MILSPEWDRTCGDCKKWWYQDGPDVPAGRRGLPMAAPGGGYTPRPAHGKTPCYQCEKVPQGVRDARKESGEDVTARDAVEPDEWHREVVKLCRKWHATGRVPEVPWAEEWHAAVRPYILYAETRPTRELVAVLTMQAATRRRG